MARESRSCGIRPRRGTSFPRAGLQCPSTLDCGTRGTCPASEPRHLFCENGLRRGHSEVLGEPSVGEPHPSWGVSDPATLPGSAPGSQAGASPLDTRSPPALRLASRPGLPHPGWAPPPSSRTRGPKASPLLVPVLPEHLQWLGSRRPSPHLRSVFLGAFRPRGGDNVTVSAGQGA